MTWNEILTERLPAYGHRNWIVVADSAYPDQSSPGIETIVSGASQALVLETVLRSLAASKHVKPNVYTDQELEFLVESDAEGISSYRDQLRDLLRGQLVRVLPHEQIIRQLDEAAQMFRVLIIKTNMTVPYTSVFLQLDCAYWGEAAEHRLRAAIQAHPER